jgi:hypothetical protein
MLDHGELVEIEKTRLGSDERYTAIARANCGILRKQAHLRFSGRLASLSKPDASQANSNPPASPSAAGTEETKK